jgi:hypothetical protein
VDRVTAKEKLRRLVDELSEQEADSALELIASRRRRSNVDQWGDLDAMTDATTAAVMRSLDAEERAAGFKPWQP